MSLLSSSGMHLIIPDIKDRNGQKKDGQARTIDQEPARETKNRTVMNIQYKCSCIVFGECENNRGPGSNFLKMEWRRITGEKKM